MIPSHREVQMRNSCEYASYGTGSSFLGQQYTTLDPKPGGSANRFLHAQGLLSHCATFLLVDIEYHLSCFDVHSSVTPKIKAVPNGKGKLCLDRPRISSLMSHKTFPHLCSSFRSLDKIFSTHNPEAFVVETTGHFFLSEQMLLLIAQLRLWSVALY